MQDCTLLFKMLPAVIRNLEPFYFLAHGAACIAECTHILCHPPDRVHVIKGERLVEALSPELTPMLASLEMPANFVPVTNAVFAEMARRGIGRQQILTALRKMGTELPQDSVEMMQVCC